MAYDDQDEPSGLVDMARGVYKKANDLADKIPTPFYSGAQKSAHDKAVDEVNKQQNDQKVQEANKSFIHPTQTSAQKKVAPAPNGKTVVTKAGPKKRM